MKKNLEPNSDSNPSNDDEEEEIDSMIIAIDNKLNGNDNECHDGNVNDDGDLFNTTNDIISGSHVSSNINTEDI